MTGRPPKHTPESRAKEAAEECRQAMPSLTFTQLGILQNIMTDHFAKAMPTRKRPAAKSVADSTRIAS